MSGVIAFVAGTGTLWTLALAGAVLFLGILVIIQFIQLAGLRRRYRAIWRGVKNLDLETLLTEHVRIVDDAEARVRSLERRCDRVERDALTHLQHLGVVRFNAFADTGSDLSFAVAFLDECQNGLVLSSLYGREESRVYAKPIVAGQSTYFLTAEEKQALERAMQPSGTSPVSGG